MSTPHATRGWVGSIVAALAAACGPQTPDSPGAQAEVDAREREPQRSAPEPRELPKLFGERNAPREEWDAENVRRNDPDYDGWPSEVAALRVEARLAELLPRLWNADAGELDGMLAPDFECASDLRPAKLASVFDDGGTRVLRAQAIERTPRGANELAGVLAALREPFAAAPVSARFELVAVDAVGERELATDVFVEASGAPGGKPVQQNARWRVRWTSAGDGEPLRVRAIELASFEEVRAAAFQFADHTGRVFGANPHFEREFRLGIDDYYFRNDQLTGNDFLGGQGLCVGDFDGDGLEDLYVPMQGGLPNRLFFHREDGTAVEASIEAKVAFLDPSASALAIDADGDGDQDLAVALRENVLVAYNDGRGAFDDQVLLKSPSPEDVYSLAAADPDRDGDLDLYACRYSRDAMIGAVPTPYHDAHNGAPNVYWRNEGGRRFVNATDEAGFGAQNDRYSLAALWEDFDDDGDVDLFVANDFGRNNLFRNEGGRFRDVAAECGLEGFAAGMGATSADFDLDGDLDLYVSNMGSAPGLRTTRVASRFLREHPELLPHYVHHASGNTLFSNRGGGRFEELGSTFGVARGGWAWGAKFVDFGGDGYADLFVPNGFITSAQEADVASFFWRRVISQSPPAPPTTENYRQAWASIQRMVMNDGLSWASRERDRAFLNLRGGSFADVSACSGLDRVEDARAAAVLDWDDDGKLDLLVKYRNAPRLRYLRNQDPAPRHWLELELASPAGNRDAIGARAVVELEGRTLRDTVRAGDGYLAQSSKRLHFGLGESSRAKRVSVRWPDGAEQSFADLAADARYRIVQGAAKPVRVERRASDAFARAAASPVERLPGGVRRVPLVERIPIAALPLPSFDGAPRKVGDLRELALITLWSSASEPSVQDLAALAERRAELRELGLALVPLSIDEESDLLAARRLVAQHGLQQTAGYADGNLRRLLEVLLITVLGRSGDVPVPTSLLVDANGDWLIAYLGPLDFAALREDVELVRALGARRRTDRLLGGRWAVHPERDLGVAAEVFQTIGASEMAAACRSVRASAGAQDAAPEK